MSRYSIETYNKKRNFKLTAEPAGKINKKSKKSLIFVVHKHAASKLHYDFRLEMGGVLKSWAVPKGPSPNPQDKRLAVRTEDHPLSYATFEGIIPKKHYGAGTVMVWDQGKWQPETDDPLQSLAEGKLSFRLYGEKFQGEWNLVRMGNGRKNAVENWLLIKTADEHLESSAAVFLKNKDKSVVSGRALADIGTDLTPSSRKLLEKYSSMQLATLVNSPPVSGSWLHEIKYDGYRIMVFVNAGDIVIRTRGGHNWTDKFPFLKAALSQLNAGNFVIDGEAVVLNKQGISSFQALQNALREGKNVIRVYFFDLLYWNGIDYSVMPLVKRMKTLAKLFKSVPGKGVLFLSETINGDAKDILQHACNSGLEGIVSKEKNARYQPGRSRAWLKSKCTKHQEFIVTGFIPASDAPQSIGALHLGYNENSALVYGGKIGTGYDRKEAQRLYRILKKLARPSAPFPTRPVNADKKTVWVNPELVCEVKFAEWTEDGKIRHGSYQGLRLDKTAEEVMPEHSRPVKTVRKSKSLSKVKGITITHPERIIFPDTELTKAGLAEFYAEFAELILPDISNCPITVVRCPGGIAEECFYQRGKESMPQHVYAVELSHKGEKHDYMSVKNLDGLLELIQMGVIEIHPWGSKLDKIEIPDRVIFDLDPSADVPFEAVKLAALDVKQRFDTLGLESFLRTTGGKGIHVSIPINRRHNWEVIKNFAGNFARDMVADTPDAYVSTMSKKKREGKIFIDYFRNDYAATAVMNYCVRSRPGAPVAVPLSWKELDNLKKSDQFAVRNIRNRKKMAGKLLEQYQNCHQSLTQRILKIFS